MVYRRTGAKKYVLESSLRYVCFVFNHLSIKFGKGTYPVSLYQAIIFAVSHGSSTWELANKE